MFPLPVEFMCSFLGVLYSFTVTFEDIWRRLTLDHLNARLPFGMSIQLFDEFEKILPFFGRLLSDAMPVPPRRDKLPSIVKVLVYVLMVPFIDIHIRGFRKGTEWKY